MKVLAGDVGGTKTLLAAFEVRGGDLLVLHEKRYLSDACESLAAIVDAFRSEFHIDIDAACFAVAGPVVGNRFTGPNLVWSVDIDRFGLEIGVSRTAVINDFQAVGYGLDRLADRDLEVLQAGIPQPKEPIALLGAGTGLGEAYLTWENGRYRVRPSEGGHSDFGPTDPLQDRLLDHLRTLYGHVSYERIVSGPGLVDLYRFLVGKGIAASSTAVSVEMDAEDPAAVVSGHGLAQDDEACTRALDLFAAVYGAEAGNLALKIFATGGVYLAGGIAARVIDKLRDGRFLRAFRDKGRHGDLVRRIPVSVILNPRVGLLGAAAVAADERLIGER